MVSGQQRKVYFTQGHGEKDTTSSERDGYNAIADRARPRELHRRQARDRAAGLGARRCVGGVVAGPKNDFFAPEVDALKKYLDKQGKLLLELDPPDKADSPPLTNLIALAHDWGIQVGNNIVVDVSGMGRMIGTDASVPVVAPPYPSHPITQRFSMLTAFPLAREASPVSGGVNGHIAQSFIETSPRSWAETDLKSLMTSGEVSLDESKGDKKGPIPLGSAVSAAAAPAAPPKPGETDAPKPETRVAVIGDSDFAANGTLGDAGQPRPVHEHDRLAVAAGEPDFDPAEGSRRSPDHADRDAGVEHLLAVAADHPRLHLRRRDRLPGGGGEARCAA